MVRADGASFWRICGPPAAGRRMLDRPARHQRSAKRARRTSDQHSRLREAQRIGKLGSLDWDLATNDIVLSEETLEMYGPRQGHDETDSGNSHRASHPDDKERVEDSLRVAIAGGARHDMEHRMVRPDGDEIVIHATAELIRDPGGKPFACSGRFSTSRNPR